MLGESGEDARHRAAARLLARGGRAAGAAARPPPRRSPRPRSGSRTCGDRRAEAAGRAGADRRRRSGASSARRRGRSTTTSARRSRASSSASPAGASSSARSTRSPSASTSRRARTSRASRPSAPTWRRALSELQGLIRETDRKIHAAFEETFDATQRNFEELVEHLFPGGRGRLRLVDDRRGPKPVLGGGEEPGDAGPSATRRPGREAEEAGRTGGRVRLQGVEIEVTPAGKATRRLSLLSGGEKALVALAFVFAVFLARPSPFYILDEVEAALDDANIDRFLQLVNRFSDRAQFIIVTHQKRTMDAADVLYGVSMGKGGVTKVVSRRFDDAATQPQLDEETEAA